MIINKIQRSYVFDQLQYISPKNVIFLKAFNAEYFYIEAWFADQNYEPLEIEVKQTSF